jgi:hypothetical protein
LRARAAGLRRSALGASDADPGGSAAAGGGYPGGDISVVRPTAATGRHRDGKPLDGPAERQRLTRETPIIQARRRGSRAAKRAGEVDAFGAARSGGGAVVTRCGAEIPPPRRLIRPASPIAAPCAVRQVTRARRGRLGRSRIADGRQMLKTVFDPRPPAGSSRSIGAAPKRITLTPAAPDRFAARRSGSQRMKDPHRTALIHKGQPAPATAMVAMA